jgi:DNA polymerase III subunit beta
VKLSVMQENLARGLSVVSRAVSNRSLPVLTNVLLKTEDAGLKLTATNLEIGITYWVPGKIETDGATSVPARLLTDLVNSLPGGEPIILELGEGETLHIRSGRFESNIKGISADRRRTADHPDLAEGPQAGSRRDCLRRGERRGATDPHRRPRPV